MQSLFSLGLGMFLPVELTAVFIDVLRQAQLATFGADVAKFLFSLCKLQFSRLLWKIESETIII